MKDRVLLFDIMKGFAITLVVMGHLIQYGMVHDYPLYMEFIGHIHMPLFFFISGWFVMKIDEKNKFVMPNIAKRFLQLIIPMVVISSLWVLYAPENGLDFWRNITFLGLWRNGFKYGYWFTLTLFEIICCYKILIPVINRFRGKTVFIFVTILSLTVLYIITLLNDRLGWGDIFCLHLVSQYFAYFMFGIFAHRFKEWFCALTFNSWFQTVIIPLFIALTIMTVNMHVSLVRIVLCMLVRFLGIFIAFNVFTIFETYCRRLPSSAFGNKILRICCYVGRNSLTIYFVHYFFLFYIGDYLEGLMASMRFAFVPTITISFVMTILIIIACMLVLYMVRPSKVLTYFLTGSYK